MSRDWKLKLNLVIMKCAKQFANKSTNVKTFYTEIVELFAFALLILILYAFARKKLFFKKKKKKTPTRKFSN